ncbi:hypothetical protein BDN72DRAFT_862429 [Pluteus cervinus]|uniref:Uncharacterized protein n=1 Tax=Pluteus cervinus TaxID=181527 RepID=A0ACD3AB74_9AGAR|nr:hypothetical protein BDN72DRAFT_862429 [Pluteus cervinus]
MFGVEKRLGAGWSVPAQVVKAVVDRQVLSEVCWGIRALPSDDFGTLVAVGESIITESGGWGGDVDLVVDSAEEFVRIARGIGKTERKEETHLDRPKNQHSACKGTPHLLESSRAQVVRVTRVVTALGIAGANYSTNGLPSRKDSKTASKPSFDGTGGAGEVETSRNVMKRRMRVVGGADCGVVGGCRPSTDAGAGN